MKDFIDENKEHDVNHLHEEDADAPVVVMVDPETNEEYEFVLADEFTYKDEDFCVLVTTEEEEEAAYIIVRFSEGEDGMQEFISLDASEEDEIYEEYERLLEEYNEESDD